MRKIPISYSDGRKSVCEKNTDRTVIFLVNTELFRQPEALSSPMNCREAKESGTA
jgi:hypothetical protein